MNDMNEIKNLLQRIAGSVEQIEQCQAAIIRNSDFGYPQQIDHDSVIQSHQDSQDHVIPLKIASSKLGGIAHKIP